MNTLRIEKKLAEKYGYAPMPAELSRKYREYFTQNIPSFLCIGGAPDTLRTRNGTVLCDGYERIVIGDYGAFIEFREPAQGVDFIIQPGQEFRVEDPKYTRRVKYIWLTVPDGSGVKIYLQKRRVLYADYLPGMYYVSVHEVVRRGRHAGVLIDGI